MPDLLHRVVTSFDGHPRHQLKPISKRALAIFSACFLRNLEDDYYSFGPDLDPATDFDWANLSVEDVT